MKVRCLSPAPTKPMTSSRATESCFWATQSPSWPFGGALVKNRQAQEATSAGDSCESSADAYLISASPGAGHGAGSPFAFELSERTSPEPHAACHRHERPGPSSASGAFPRRRWRPGWGFPSEPERGQCHRNRCRSSHCHSRCRNHCRSNRCCRSHCRSTGSCSSRSPCG